MPYISFIGIETWPPELGPDGKRIIVRFEKDDESLFEDILIDDTKDTSEIGRRLEDLGRRLQAI
jgi:hypothetical protein